MPGQAPEHAAPSEAPRPARRPNLALSARQLAYEAAAAASAAAGAAEELEPLPSGKRRAASRLEGREGVKRRRRRRCGESVAHVSPTGRAPSKEKEPRVVELRAAPGADASTPAPSSGLVLCTSHGKWRHPDRMARKGNGDWVCTGDDRCRVGDDGNAADSVSAVWVGRSPRQGKRLKLRAAVQVPRVREGPIGAPAEPKPRGKLKIVRVHTGRKARLVGNAGEGGDEIGGGGAASWDGGDDWKGSGHGGWKSSDHSGWQGDDRGGKRREAKTGSIDGDWYGSRQTGTAKGRAAKAKTGGDSLPPGTALCELHQKPRKWERLTKQHGGGWACKPGFLCRNTEEEVKCSVHGRWRTPQNMERGDGDGWDNWVCKPDCECR